MRFINQDVYVHLDGGRLYRKSYFDGWIIHYGMKTALLFGINKQYFLTISGVRIESKFLCTLGTFIDGPCFECAKFLATLTNHM